MDYTITKAPKNALTDADELLARAENALIDDDAGFTKAELQSLDLPATFMNDAYIAIEPMTF